MLSEAITCFSCSDSRCHTDERQHPRSCGAQGKEVISLGPHILIHEGYFTLCEMNKTVNCDSQDLVILAVTALGELRYAPFQYPRLRGKGLCHDTVEQSCARGRCVKCSEAAHNSIQVHPRSGTSYSIRPVSPRTLILLSVLLLFIFWHIMSPRLALNSLST